MPRVHTSTMNRERLEQMAALFAHFSERPSAPPLGYGDIVSSIRKVGFTMQNVMGASSEDFSGEHCRTCACILGWETMLWGETRNGHLGLEPPAYDELTLPRGWHTMRYTPLEVARVLCHLLATGWVDWTVAHLHTTQETTDEP